eukprot:2888947-Rhodomonas_salina.1
MSGLEAGCRRSSTNEIADHGILPSIIDLMPLRRSLCAFAVYDSRNSSACSAPSASIRSPIACPDSTMRRISTRHGAASAQGKRKLNRP